MKIVVLMVALVTLFFITTGCSRSQADTGTEQNGSSMVKDETELDKAMQNAAKSEADVIESAPQKTLVFFMNPGGRPCQIQDQVIVEMKDELSDLAKLKYVKTTNPDDRESFYKYGIRGLPSMIILDEEGNVAHRFSPGIQSSEQIIKALKG